MLANPIPSVKKDTPEQLVAKISHLTSLPSAYTRLEETLKDPNHTRDDIADIISIDAGLCARTLRIINSSYYALPKTIHNIGTAINLIGEDDLRNIVLISSAVNSVAALVDNGIDISAFWRHSIRCGITAKLLTKYTSLTDKDLLFLTGLLHDLGQLVIYKNEPELSATISWHVKNEDKTIEQVEETLLGFAHPIIGALLLENWGVPEQISEIIKYHHQPEHSTQFRQETVLISLADQLVHFIELNNNLTTIDYEQLPTLINKYLTNLNISKQILTDLFNEVIEQSKAIEEIICND